MSSIGAIGSVGEGASTASAMNGINEAGGTNDIGKAEKNAGTTKTANNTDKVDAQSQTGFYGSSNNIMSTEDHFRLQSSIACGSQSQEAGGLDLKKLLEMIMAIRLLQEMNKASQSVSPGGNLNITA